MSPIHFRIFSKQARAGMSAAVLLALAGGASHSLLTTPASSPAALGACTTTVSSAANAASALSSANNGAVVCLAAGSYPGLTLSNIHPAGYITLQPVPGAGVTVAGIQTNSVSFLRIQGLAMNAGINMVGTGSASHDVQIIGNSIGNTAYGVVLDGSGGPITNVLIQGNNIHDLDFQAGLCATNPTPPFGGYAGGQGVTLYGGDGVTIKDNTFQRIGAHYIQGGGSALGVTVDHNLFEGPPPADAYCAHLNVWQIWAGGNNDTFSNNIVYGTPGSPSAFGALMFETGPGGGDCSDSMTNTVVNNNLFVNEDTSFAMQIMTTKNLTVTNNTVVGSAYGTLLERSDTCGPGTNMNVSRNVVTNNTNGSLNYVFGGCTGTCTWNDNVSQDGSATTPGHWYCSAGCTALNPTNVITGWAPKWTNTSWNGSGTPPSGYYQPVGLPFAAGWQPIAASGPTPAPTPAPTATPTPVSTSTPVPTLTATATPTPAPSSAFSIWPSSVLPAAIDSNDTRAVELGLKFSSDVATTVTGVRFYKSAANTGVHTGSLWNSSGTRMATVTFASESASGWQTALFSSPVAIAANTTYTVSYHTAAGHYSDSSEYFAGSATNSGTLHAPSSSAAGGNGVYLYGASAFPNQTYKATNYWVDVLVAPPAPVAVNAAPCKVTINGVQQTGTCGGTFTAATPGTISATTAGAHLPEGKTLLMGLLLVGGVITTVVRFRSRRGIGSV